MSNNLGQYFTTNETLQQKVYEFIKNDPINILEPSMGRGDLIQYIQTKKNIGFIGYEIDQKIELLHIINIKIIYGDFLKENINNKFKTIIGNPPFVRTKKGNLYIDFIEKCYGLLEEKGELIFIVPSDFFKLTCASNLLSTMLSNGSFTDIFHPNNEKMFDDANIDVFVFRYCKDSTSENSTNKKVMYNNESMFINFNKILTISKELITDKYIFEDFFDIYVGLVNGKEEVFRNSIIGNFTILNGYNKSDKYIKIDTFPSGNQKIDNWLLFNKQVLLDRKIRKFNETNWYEWGALRNISVVNNNLGKRCIFIKNLTRNDNPAFIGDVTHFGGSLLIMIPKKQINLNNVVDYLNSDKFKTNFMFSGRFKLGHRQLCNSPYSSYIGS
jgi:adenine-specific DNA-methyltransferase